MSLYVAQVGDIIIKPEVRNDFGYFFEQKYSLISNTVLQQFVSDFNLTKSQLLFIPLMDWTHFNYKKEWYGKYETSYDKETGRFIFGVSYNIHGPRATAMIEFLGEVLPVLTEQELFLDGWVEPL